ncbi:MAG: hypothetical protein ABI113_10195 [Mucilaginibacter sp.]
MNPIAQKIIDTCEANFDANAGNCSGFVKAVSADLSVTLTGQADDIVDQIQTADWQQLADGVEAKAKADEGWLVVGGLQGGENVPPQIHGHVVIVVSGPLAHDLYPSGYWGKLGSIGKKNTTINWAWNTDSRDKVIYAAVQV